MSPLFQNVSKRLVGQDYEQQAKKFLASNNVQCIEQNFNCKTGEIDLICIEQSTYLFVEVRFRAKSSHGSAAATITPSKQKKVKSAAMYYLQQNKLNINHTAIRFDAVVFDQDSKNPNWIKNAF
ncbi:YraN family protein [Catenovulum maritimum]|uniref:UPF0102 protein XM47_13990 n=1 Tax=Catenovulum maritimum TaxID=1513271 RepID=A0A0J8GTD4_9ALTE|nr:YraN family protein [Catenovulum maritimum]KMT64559.1 hypothetical protein XM47_13990 [Catenovulum maritimum]